MTHFFVKSINVGILLLLPLFYGSTVHMNTSDVSTIGDGHYLLKTKGDRDINLQGIITFETATEQTVRGEKYNTLKLNLEDTKSINGHSFGFLISKSVLKADRIGKGTYKVTSNINGFLNYFDGVFGFANISAFGESPFFAKTGSITIDSITDSKVKGNLEILFENPSGETMTVSGMFVAQNK